MDHRVGAVLAAFCAATMMFVSGDKAQDQPSCKFTHQIRDHPAAHLLQKIAGERFSVNDNMDEYTYNVGICTDAEDPSVARLPFPHAGIVRRQKANAKSTAVVVGRYSDSNFMAGSNWIMLEYRDGTKYNNRCGEEKRRGAIMILCDPNETEGSLQIIEENTNKTAECYYLFELTHAAVCPEDVIASNAQGLSPGSIFVIVFIALVSVYFVVGFLYQRFVAGAKGWEQFPNASFWQDFGNLLADGCELVCRSGSRPHRAQANSRTYKGIGDDQLQDDSDFDRDEHLLPM